MRSVFINLLLTVRSFFRVLRKIGLFDIKNKTENSIFNFEWLIFRIKLKISDIKIIVGILILELPSKTTIYSGFEFWKPQEKMSEP